MPKITHGLKRCHFMKERTEFPGDKNRLDGCYHKCNVCVTEETRKKRETFNGFIGTLLNTTNQNANKRNININITTEDIINLYNDQHGRCAISSMKLTYGYQNEKSEAGNRNLYNISVDRIDNIQLVCNSMKNILSTIELTSLCYLIDRYQMSLREKPESNGTIYHGYLKQYSNIFMTHLNDYYGDLKRRAKDRGIEMQITIKDLLNLYDQQNGRCKLSGLRMTYDQHNNRLHYNISVDRIMSNKLYTMDNIQLVCAILIQ